MKIIHHRGIRKDLHSALAYYHEEGGEKLADRFFAAVEEAISKAVRNPKGFPFASPAYRRIPLRSFPYHFLYEENSRRIHFLVLRHDKRHPDFGLRRR